MSLNLIAVKKMKDKLFLSLFSLSLLKVRQYHNLLMYFQQSYHYVMLQQLILGRDQEYYFAPSVDLH